MNEAPRRKYPLPRTVRQKRELMLRVILWAGAAVLLVVGFATPQIVQAIEFQSRGTYVEQLTDHYVELEQLYQRNDAQEILIGLKLNQVKRMQTAIEEVVALQDQPLSSSQIAELEDAVQTLDTMRQEQNAYSTFQLLPNAVETAQQIRESGPVEANAEYFKLSVASWPTEGVDFAIQTFDVKPPLHRDLPEDHSKMTNAQFAEVKNDLRDATTAIATQKERSQQLVADLNRIEQTTHETFKSIEAVATQALNGAEGLLERATDLEFDSAAFEDSIAKTRQALNGGPFAIAANGHTILAPKTLPEDAIAVEGLSEINRGLLIAQALKTYLAQFITAEAEITELEEIREAEILAQEEYERQLAYEQELLRQQQEQQQQTPAEPTDPGPDPGSDEGEEPEVPVDPPVDPTPEPDPSDPSEP